MPATLPERYTNRGVESHPKRLAVSKFDCWEAANAAYRPFKVTTLETQIKFIENLKVAEEEKQDGSQHYKAAEEEKQDGSQHYKAAEEEKQDGSQHYKQSATLATQLTGVFLGNAAYKSPKVIFENRFIIWFEDEEQILPPPGSGWARIKSVSGQGEEGAVDDVPLTEEQLEEIRNLFPSPMPLPARVHDNDTRSKFCHRRRVGGPGTGVFLGNAAYKSPKVIFDHRRGVRGPGTGVFLGNEAYRSPKDQDFTTVGSMWARSESVSGQGEEGAVENVPLTEEQLEEIRNLFTSPTPLPAKSTTKALGVAKTPSIRLKSPLTIFEDIPIIFGGLSLSSEAF
ncbi:hypothetical protein QBC40DRAFT_251567 [Triangularia verruculosa]|uniref:Uncharacterized protein n=1 Tax=Triangularia verruculosa TaxID=2587418 RepID=A0AAN7AZG0_9PEZI|nr:hypothetical protein QBC40DRAFT_251567 [Triangularia verruculosa]